MMKNPTRVRVGSSTFQIAAAQSAPVKESGEMNGDPIQRTRAKPSKREPFRFH